MSQFPISIPDLINQGMRPELHWFPEDVPATRLAATLVGMANTRGGTVLIGVSPRAGRIQGVHDRKELTDRIFQAALLSDPPLVLPVPSIESVQSLAVLRVTVPEGLPHVYNLEGRYLGRSGRRENRHPASQASLSLRATVPNRA